MDNEQDVEKYIQELADNYGRQMGDFPESPTTDTQLQFMRDVVQEEDGVKQTKTANLNKEEAGKTKVSSLGLLNASSYADTEGYQIVSDYLRERAVNLAAVTLGRNAKLIDTLFTVRRETMNLGTPRTTKKKGLFGSTTTTEGIKQ